MLSHEPSHSDGPTSIHGQRAICIVSLGAKIMTPEYFATLLSYTKQRDWTLQLILLDTMEEANLKFLELGNLVGIDETIALRCKEIEDFVQVHSSEDPASISSVRFSLLATAANFSSYAKAVKSCFESNKHFQNLCLHQTFRNLHPRLVRVGVRSQRNDTVRCLVDYLLDEISIKLFVGSESLADIEIAPMPEMKVMEDLYSGRFPELRHLCVSRLNFVIVRQSQGP